MRLALFFVASLSLTRAPMQCATRRTHELRSEDSPGEALWNLAETFRCEGETRAAEQTLRALAERYPSSRYAQRATDVLGARVTNDAGCPDATSRVARSAPDNDSGLAQ